jgi:SPP1 gp7 family putative phage head morphogenesis protein
VALTAAQLARLLAKVMKAAGIGLLALRAVAVLVMSWPQDVLEGTGPAQRYTTRQNTLRRAQFFWAACKRVQDAVAAARSRNQPASQAVRDALATEKRYLAMHVTASANRMQAATTVDGMAAAFGNLLGWNAVKDSRCSPGCRAASGKNFRADKPPVIEGAPSYPGAAHPSCRCFPSAPHKGAPLLP